METDIIKLGRDTDQEFRWKPDLGFSSGDLSENFLYFKEKLEIEVRYTIYAKKISCINVIMIKY